MSFTPKQINEEISNGKEVKLKKVFLLLLMLVTASLGAIYLLTELIFFGIKNISYQSEKMIFSQAKFEKAFSDNSSSSLYLTQLKNKLLQHDKELAELIDIKLLCSKELNAFALPGGKVFISSELIKRVKSENALSTVIAHEISHVRQRDHLRALTFTAAYKILSTLFFDGNKLSFLSNPIDLQQLYHTRKAEEIADRYAKELLIKHYGHFNGAQDFFKVILKEEGDHISFLNTHPSTKKRIKFFESQEEKELKDISENILDSCRKLKGT